MSPLLLAAVALSAAAGGEALQLTPRPPRGAPPKSASPPTSTWRRSGTPDRRQRSKPLRAYTVAENKSNSNWLSFLRLPKLSLEEFASQFGAEDSLLSFEGGNSGAAATRPSMPNLELEAATITAANGADAGASLENEQLVSELTALTKAFEKLQSDMDYTSHLHSETIQSYEAKVARLEEKNASLEEGLQTLTATLERQEQQLMALQNGEKDPAEKQGDDHNDVSFLLQVQENVVELEGENDMLRRRVRALEVELSDLAFESRHRADVAPPAVVASSVAEQKEAVDTSDATLSPKAPSAPVPPHVYQLDQLQRQVAVPSSSVRKLFGHGMRRALHLWSPVHNLQLWGKLRG